jgi:tetratricopeptide (TPR) repeat protein
MIVVINAPIVMWWACGILLCMAIGLAWLSWRALSAPLFQTAAHGASESTGQALLAELEPLSPWPTGVSPPVLAAEINELVRAARFDEALACIDHCLTKSPTNLLLRFWKVATCTSADRIAEAEQTLGDLVEQPSLTAGCRAELLVMRLSLVFKQGHQERVAPLVESFFNGNPPMTVRIRVLDYLACVPFMEGHRQYLPEADRWSHQLVAFQPQNVTLKGTRGALLVEQGRFDEAEPLLNEVYATSESDMDRGISSLYLAIVAKHRSNHREARRLAERARRTYRPAWLIQRVKQEFPDIRI